MYRYPIPLNHCSHVSGTSAVPGRNEAQHRLEFDRKDTTNCDPDSCRFANTGGGGDGGAG